MFCTLLRSYRILMKHKYNWILFTTDLLFIYRELKRGVIRTQVVCQISQDVLKVMLSRWTLNYHRSIAAMLNICFTALHAWDVVKIKASRCKIQYHPNLEAFDFRDAIITMIYSWCSHQLPTTLAMNEKQTNSLRLSAESELKVNSMLKCNSSFCDMNTSMCVCVCVCVCATYIEFYILKINHLKNLAN